MTSGTVFALSLLLLGCSSTLAQTQQAQFNQVLNINGDMALNSFQFPDRSKIETFSQKQQQLIVNQQTPAIPPNQVTGSTGQPFVAMMPQSMSISTNGATDLVGGSVQLAIDPNMLATNAVNPDNTFVAMLSPDRQTWMIQETMRSINASDMTVRMVKRTTLDGEYMALGRQTVETNAVLTPFGSDGATQVAILGTGLQENEFQDGFRMSTKASQPMTMNVDVKEGIDTGMLAALSGQEPVNDFRYSVTSNLAGLQPNLNQQVTVIQMPLNAQRLQAMMQAAGVQAGGQVALSVAQRGVLQNPGGATGNLGGAAAPVQRRGRSFFRRQVQGATAQQDGVPQDQAGALQQAGIQQAGVPQAQAGTTQQAGTQQAGILQAQAGTPTIGNNPVASQLLLAPTFTPIQANLVLDSVNMRVAFPVSAVDGEYIITMQLGSARAQAPEAAPQQGQAEGQGQASAKGQAPKLEGAAGNNTNLATEGQKPQGEAANATTPATEGEKKPEGEAAAKPEGGKKAERRQEKKEPAIGDKAPQGSVYITMKEVNQMAALAQWGGQAPISQMMTEYVMANNGSSTQ